MLKVLRQQFWPFQSKYSSLLLFIYIASCITLTSAMPSRIHLLHPLILGIDYGLKFSRIPSMVQKPFSWCLWQYHHNASSILQRRLWFSCGNICLAMEMFAHNLGRKDALSKWGQHINKIIFDKLHLTPNCAGHAFIKDLLMALLSWWLVQLMTYSLPLHL